MDEILNNLEEISNLLAENKNFSLKDFSPISKLIAKTQNQVIRLCEVGVTLKEKEVPTFDEWLNFNKYTRIKREYFKRPGGLVEVEERLFKEYKERYQL